MTDIRQQAATAYANICDQMNERINQKGQLKPSDLIKEWHAMTNEDWQLILSMAKYLHQNAGVRLSGKTERDIDNLLDHVEQYGDSHPNILNPSPKHTNRLAKRVTQINGDTSVKTVLWRTMMNIRESYCKEFDIDLPNEDSSKGTLKKSMDLFEY